MRRRGLGIVVNGVNVTSNPAGLNAAQLALLTPDQLGMYNSVGFYDANTPQQMAAILAAGPDNPNPPLPTFAPSRVAPSAPVITSTPPSSSPVVATPPGGWPQACPAWGCGTAPIFPITSLPVPSPTSTQPVGSAPASTGFDLSSIPWWVWAGGAAALFFAFGGAGGGR